MSEQLRLFVVAGARPNFVKIAPVLHAIRAWNGGARGWKGLFEEEPAGERSSFIARWPGDAAGGMRIDAHLVHTGQHYDDVMSSSFFRDLDIPEPDVNLEVGPGSHAVQTARVLERFEEVLNDTRPDVVLVVGDVNSTAACCLAAVKRGVPVAHVEAGLRSFDRGMPEEVNRLVTDSLARLLLVSEESGLVNLQREGVHPARIRYCGNVMIDSLTAQLAKADKQLPFSAPEEGYAVLTLHRPSNVDVSDVLSEIVKGLEVVAGHVPVMFPAHPRTRRRIQEFGLGRHFVELNGQVPRPGSIYLMPPVPYRSMLAVTRRAKLVLTDSGGLQEETTFLGVPCLTIRENTERPVTVTRGSNTLVGTSAAAIASSAEAVFAGKYKRGTVPPLWDGHAAERIVGAILEWWVSTSRDTFPLIQ